MLVGSFFVFTSCLRLRSLEVRSRKQYFIIFQEILPIQEVMLDHNDVEPKMTTWVLFTVLTVLTDFSSESHQR